MESYQEAIDLMEGCFLFLEKRVEAPEYVSEGKGKIFKYKNESLEAAIIQKLARAISGLNACQLLLSNGYFQELGALFRTLDEFNEDINFLCLPLLGKELTQLHMDYLDAFYQKEFDNPENAFLSTQKRPMVPRKKIMAAISNIDENPVNSHDSKEILRTLGQTYGGYVHGASEHIMEMYSSPPGMYHLKGMLGTKRWNEFYSNMWDYVYRTLHSVMFVAMSFQQDKMLSDLFAFRDYFERKTNRAGKGDAAKELKKVKKKGLTK